MSSEAVKATRRRAAGIRLTFVAGQLDFLTNEKLVTQMEDDLRYMTPVERKYLDDTIDAIGKLDTRLRKLANRLGVE